MDRARSSIPGPVESTSPANSWIVGISGLRTGTAVSLFRDTALQFAIEEEKLRRSKGGGILDDRPRPSLAVDAALRHAGIDGGRVEETVYTPEAEASPERVAEDVAFLGTFLARYHAITAPVRIVDHARAQTALAAAVEPDADAVVMVGRNRTVVSRPGSDIARSSPSSVVRTMEIWIEFLGLTPSEVHHLENMAQAGEPRFADRLHGMADEGIAKIEALEGALECPRLRRGSRPSAAHLDAAASMHAVLVRHVKQTVESVMAGGAHRRIALCGGVFHSWRLNDALADAFPECHLGVSFAPGNAGCAIGGPMAAHPGAPGDRPVPFLGPVYGRDEVKGVLDNCKARYAFHQQSDLVSEVCAALDRGRMVGWFEGRCEFGLRALGARSVFANPADPYACDNLSSYLKKRPAYMSYAVVMTEDAAPVASPFMSRSTRLPAYFGTSPVRIQTVSRTTSPSLFQLIERFRELTGVPALLNTSLNYFDEPIACAPRDAVKTFFASGLDMLAMENFLLSKS